MSPMVMTQVYALGIGLIALLVCLAVDYRDNGWFIFFAPRDNPQIAGVVFLEHGIHGPNAASIAHHILATFFAKQDGKPLPTAPTHEDLRLDYKDPYARGGGGPVGGGH